MLVVTQSNRLEMLADRLVERLCRSPPPPLVPEIVVVQSTGMARWLTLRLARDLGVSANVRFPLPAAYLWEVFRTLVDGVPDASPLEPAVSAWHLVSILESLDDTPRFATIRAYHRAADERGRYELAARLADLFDQYLVYRPGWIARWEAGEDDGWQAELWRRLVRRTTEPHRAQVQAMAMRALASGAFPRPLPSRLAIFGIPSLPPAYLHAFRRLADHVDVDLFLLNPCREYWADLVAERDLPRRTGRSDARALHLETGPPLLASLGRQGRDFLDLVLECEPHREEEAFASSGDDCLLHTLQSEILTLRTREQRTAIAADDRSLQVHVCHGPVREIEVLHDQLLGLFERHPGLTPADVVVMTPDIAAYAPAIEAVFGGAPLGRRIPFTIADQSLRAESALVAAFLSLLDLSGSRYDASQLLALLETPAVHRRFGLGSADVDLVRRLVAGSGIRWGVDPAARARLGLPAEPEHTWRFGLDRLLLGFALAGDQQRRLVGDVLPYEAVEGSDALVLGRLAAFVEATAALGDTLAAPRSVAAWSARVTEALERFLAPDDEETAAVQAVGAALDRLADDAARAAFDAPISLDLFRVLLDRELERPAQRGRFLAGGVTFCALVPMRSLPFEVVCLVGMNDGSFPRTRPPLSFDLVAAHPERGDRSRREDDRYLFLEALLSARRCLYLSYVGRSIRDNAPIPPSVVVGELLDAVQRGFENADLVTVHPLQPFSPRYFESPPARGLLSYSAELCQARRIRLGDPVGPRRLLETRLPDDPEWRRVTLRDFLDFFANPTAFLLRRRLRIRLEEAAAPIESREPFVLDSLDVYRLRSELLALHADEHDLRDVLPLVRARGLLPHGRVGEVELARQRAVVEDFAERLAAFAPGEAMGPLPVDLALGPVVLEGTLHGVAPHGLVDYRLAKAKARDQLLLWIRHLVMHLVAPVEVARRSVWLGNDKALVFGVVDDPLGELGRLGATFHEGVHRLLPLFPATSLAWVEEGGNLNAAREAWEGNDFVDGEACEPHLAFAWRDLDPFGDEFETLARRTMEPLLAHRTEEKA